MRQCFSLDSTFLWQLPSEQQHTFSHRIWQVRTCYIWQCFCLERYSIKKVFVCDIQTLISIFTLRNKSSAR